MGWSHDPSRFFLLKYGCCREVDYYPGRGIIEFLETKHCAQDMWSGCSVESTQNSSDSVLDSFQILQPGASSPSAVRKFGVATCPDHLRRVEFMSLHNAPRKQPMPPPRTLVCFSQHGPNRPTPSSFLEAVLISTRNILTHGEADWLSTCTLVVRSELLLITTGFRECPRKKELRPLMLADTHTVVKLVCDWAAMPVVDHNAKFRTSAKPLWCNQGWENHQVLTSLTRVFDLLSEPHNEGVETEVW